MKRYAVVIEKAAGNYSAYVPDLPGCVATAATVEAIEKEIRARHPLSHRRPRGGWAEDPGADQHRRIHRGVKLTGPGLRRDDASCEPRQTAPDFAQARDLGRA